MRFHTTIRQGGKTTTGIEVPPAIVEALGQGKRPPVRVTLNGYTYRSSIAVMAGKFMVGVSADVRAKSGVTGGDAVDVDIEVDTEKREVAVPKDLQAALNGDAAAKASFDHLAYSHKLRHVLVIEDAKTPETRQRRIDKALEMLRAGKK